MRHAMMTGVVYGKWQGPRFLCFPQTLDTSLDALPVAYYGAHWLPRSDSWINVLPLTQEDGSCWLLDQVLLRPRRKWLAQQAPWSSID
jgi:hypothetical protein